MEIVGRIVNCQLEEGLKAFYFIFLFSTFSFKNGDFSRLLGIRKVSILFKVIGYVIIRSFANSEGSTLQNGILGTFASK